MQLVRPYPGTPAPGTSGVLTADPAFLAERDAAYPSPTAHEHRPQVVVTVMKMCARAGSGPTSAALATPLSWWENRVVQTTENNQSGIGTIITSPAHVAEPGYMEMDGILVVTAADQLGTTINLTTAGDDVTTSPASFMQVTPLP